MSNAPVTAEDLYLYAMDLLDSEEQSRIHAFLPKSPEARVELANVRGDLALFAFATEPREVPVSSRQRLLLQVSREPRKAATLTAAAAALPPAENRIDAVPSYASLQDAGFAQDTYTPAATTTPAITTPAAAVDTPLTMRLGVPDEESRRGFFSSLLPWAGWAVAAGLAVSTFTYYQRSAALSGRVALANADATSANANAARAVATSARAQSVLETLRSSSAQRFVLTAATEKPAPSARVTYLAANGSLVFQGSYLDAVSDDKTYELWLIPTGEGAKPIPAGTFKPDARGFASVILPELPKGTIAGAFGVTLEPEGGTQTPTLPILLVGKA